MCARVDPWFPTMGLFAPRGLACANTILTARFSPSTKRLGPVYGIRCRPFAPLTPARAQCVHVVHYVSANYQPANNWRLFTQGKLYAQFYMFRLLLPAMLMMLIFSAGAPAQASGDGAAAGGTLGFALGAAIFCSGPAGRNLGTVCAL